MYVSLSISSQIYKLSIERKRFGSYFLHRSSRFLSSMITVQLVDSKFQNFKRLNTKKLTGMQDDLLPHQLRKEKLYKCQIVSISAPLDNFQSLNVVVLVLFLTF